MPASTHPSSEAKIAVMPGIRVPAQQRGQDSLDRLLAAGTELLALRGYDGLTLAEVAERAGVSYGAMQYRITTKDALIGAIHEEFWHYAESHAVGLLEASRWDGMSLREVVIGAVRDISTVYTHNPPLLRALSLRAGTDAAIRERVALSTHRGSRALTALLEPRLTAAGHNDPHETPKKIFTAATGAFASRTTWPEFHDGPLEWDDYVDTVCEMALGAIDAGLPK